jgi:hypothetical protein
VSECPECYSLNHRATPLLNARECLENHTQYICGTCGRCICIQADSKRKLQRWNFPFKSLEIAKLYVRTADFTTKKPCGIYEMISETGRKSYKIFTTRLEFLDYLKKSKKTSINSIPLFQKEIFVSFPNTEIRKLTSMEITKYLE